MNILVTGGAGFIGSCFVGQCVEKGFTPIVLDRLTYAGHRANLEFLPEGTYRLVVGDIADASLVSFLLAEHRIDCVVNFAAESHVDNSIEGPDDFIETNIVGTYRLLESALDHCNNLSGVQKSNFRFIQISTDEVYGSLGPEGKFSESHPFRPNSPYAASKAAADHLVRAWSRTYGLPTITTHCTNNYGPRQHPEKLIPRMITCALSDKPLPVYGDGMNVRDWIHVEDHCEGIWRAIEKGLPGQTYNIGGGQEISNIRLVQKLCALLDDLQPKPDHSSYADQISFVEDRPGHDRRYAIDNTLARIELGHVLKHKFDDGLKSTVQWYLSNGDWYQAILQEAA